jgi:hypothetical protein
LDIGQFFTPEISSGHRARKGGKVDAIKLDESPQPEVDSTFSTRSGFFCAKSLSHFSSTFIFYTFSYFKIDRRLSSHATPGVNVGSGYVRFMITILCDFRQFSAEKMRFS